MRLLVMRLPVDPDLDATDAPRLSRSVTVALVAIGGLAGTLARAGVAHAVPVRPDGWPWATLTVNVVGCLLLAVVLAGVHERLPTARVPRPLLGTGFCGGFTTFSTFALEFTTLSRAGRVGLASAYVGLSVIGSLLAALVGVALTRSALRLADREGWLRRITHAGMHHAERDRS
jgi:CrcB protein